MGTKKKRRADPFTVAEINILHDKQLLDLGSYMVINEMHIFIPETLFGQAYIWYKKILRTMHEFLCVIGNYCDVTISILIDGRIDLSMFIEDVNTSIWLWLLQTGIQISVSLLKI